MAFFSIVIAAPNIFDEKDNNIDEKDNPDNPLLTCFTNPCVQVDGVGKIMGSTKVRILFSFDLQKSDITIDEKKLDKAY